MIGRLRLNELIDDERLRCIDCVVELKAGDE